MGQAKLIADERRDIPELLARFCRGLNTGNAERVLACFRAGGAPVHPPQVRCQGETAIRSLPDALWSGRPGRGQAPTA